MPAAPTATAAEIKDVNTRYHDAAAAEYDAKWGIDFGQVGRDQVLMKVRKALGAEPGSYARSLEIGDPQARHPLGDPAIDDEMALKPVVLLGHVGERALARQRQRRNARGLVLLQVGLVHGR